MALNENYILGVKDPDGDIFEFIKCAAKEISNEAFSIISEETGVTVERIAELVKAEKDGRLLELPCKIGDTIYVIPSKVNYDLNKISHPENNKVYKQTVSGIRMYLRGDCLLETCEGFCSVLKSYFGNTWFLTREEAEAALKEMEKK